MPWLNRFSRTLGSAGRTLSRKMCMGPKKIMNSTIGSEADQCGKFSRFHQLYRKYKDDRNENVKNLMSFLNSDVLYSDEVSNALSTTRDPVSMARQFLIRFQGNRDQALMMIASIPDTPDYNALKEELRYFIPFMYQSIQLKLVLANTNSKRNYVSGSYSRRRARKTRRRRH